MMTIQQYLNNCYTIDQESDTYVTLRKKKSVSIIEVFLVVVGLPMMLFFGTGLILWILALLNYLIKSDEVITVNK